MSSLPTLPSAPRDRQGRPLRDLRLSVTDRCNFRCRYCMPREVFGPDFAFLPRSEILSFEEIARMARVAAGLGVTKIRLTGGEPLLRKDLPDLVAMLAAIPGIDDLALTTNGSLLTRFAQPLAEAGLHRVTVSLDSLDDATFARMNDTAVPVAEVLAGIDAAAAAGLTPVKVNAVVRRGINDGEVAALARRFHGSGHTLRFIEFMDVGSTNGWRLEEVVPGREILAQIDAELPVEPVAPENPSAVARRWRYRDGGGEVGIITSVTAPFCTGCTRARLSAEGRLYTCLFASEGIDLRQPLRSGASDHDLAALLAGRWEGRDDRYSELRTAATGQPSGEAAASKIEMSYIGG